ncbi:MAG: adenylate/guanylate cyclase domain-containing protein, partial [Cyanobacteriota bacterium]
ILLCLSIIFIFLIYPLGTSYNLNVYYCLSLIITYIVLNLFLFTSYSIWLDIVSPVFSSSVTIVLVVAVSLLVEKGKRSLVEETFSRYVSPQVYNKLISEYKSVDLTAYRQRITVLFSDIRGFTPFAEDLTPEEVSRYLNEYFTEMVDIILKHDGTIDKFMGDAIMAFFGAPVYSKDHAFQGVKAAIEMMEMLDTLNEKWSRQGRRMINIGIGLNTGSALIGNFGSPRLMDYTVIGDTVNLASRLESLNKEENTNILISAFTYQEVKEMVKVRIIGPKRVKGKSESVIVYEVLSLNDGQ